MSIARDFRAGLERYIEKYQIQSVTVEDDLARRQYMRR